MHLISVKSITFEKKYGEMNNEKVKFKIAGLNDVDLNFYAQGYNKSMYDGRGNVDMIINCTIELDWKTVIEGNFNFNELLKGNVIEVKE